MAYNPNDKFAWIKDNLDQHTSKGLIRQRRDNPCLKNQVCHSPMGATITEKIKGNMRVKTIKFA